MGKLDMRNVVLSVTLFMVAVYVVCRIFYLALPGQTVAFANNLFHGIEFSVKPFGFGSFIAGLIETVILSAAGSALFVWIYNRVAKK